MVHRLPNADGLVVTEFNARRVSTLIVNMITSGNVVITPRGGGGIVITLPPFTKIRIPDKIGLSIQGGTVGSGNRNFAVLTWDAGDAE